MAISLKAMRKITVNGEVFLWKIRKKVSHGEDHNDQLPIPVQHVSGGQVLFVFVGFTRAYGGYINNSPESVTPKMIEPLIRQAILLGWKYNEPGKPISLVNGSLKKDTRRAKYHTLPPDRITVTTFLEESTNGRILFCNQEILAGEPIKNKDLSNLYIYGCNINLHFEECDLSNTDFYGCDLKDSKFINCNLTGTGIRLCTVDYIGFSGNTTTGSRLHGNRYYKTTIDHSEFARIFMEKDG